MNSDVVVINKKIFQMLGGLAVVGACGFGAFTYVATTPQYSLFQLQRAVNNHDITSFNRYVDTPAVVNGLVNDAFTDFQAEMAKKDAEEAKKPKNQWEKAGYEMGKGFATLMIQAMKPKLQEAMTSAVEDGIKKSMLQLDGKAGASAPPVFAIAKVEGQGKAAWVTVSNTGNGKEMRFAMSQQPDNQWKIVALDYASFKKLK